MCDFNTNTTDFFTFNGSHTHEIIGSTVNTETCEGCHNHRYATMSGDAIPCRGSHFHRVEFRTDSHDNHFHEFCGNSSLAIPTGDGRHVHFANGCTTSANGHSHEFRFATLINNPSEECL